MSKLRWSNVVFAFAYVALVIGALLRARWSRVRVEQSDSAGDQYCNGSAADQYCTRVAGVNVSETGKR